jgi:hypothetical protein
MTATLFADVPKPHEEVAKLIISNIRVSLTSHQLLEHLLPSAHPDLTKPKRLGFSNQNCASVMAIVLILGWR